MLKELIKELAAEQVELKKQRKTGRLPEWKRNEWGWVDHREVPSRVKRSWHAAGEVRHNKARITAALNLYHEVRGSDYRHGLPPSDDWMYHSTYNSFMDELREKLEVV
jgi:hypothetical protein